MDDEDTCPHCSHLWDNHDGLLTGLQHCDVCGCMWAQPEPPLEPPTPRTPYDELVDRVEDAIWSSLEEAAQEGMGFYVDRKMDMVDGSGAGINMGAVAAGVIARLKLTPGR